MNENKQSSNPGETPQTHDDKEVLDNTIDASSYESFVFAKQILRVSIQTPVQQINTDLIKLESQKEQLFQTSSSSQNQSKEDTPKQFTFHKPEENPLISEILKRNNKRNLLQITEEKPENSVDRVNAVQTTSEDQENEQELVLPVVETKLTQGFSFRTIQANLANQSSKHEHIIIQEQFELRVQVKEQTYGQAEEYKCFHTSQGLMSDEEDQISDETIKTKRKLWGQNIATEIKQLKEENIQKTNQQKFLEIISKNTDNQQLVKHLSTRDQNSNSHFAFVVSTITIICHIYNYFTCFFFIGIQGYPQGIWYLLEIFSEMFLVFEFVMQILLRTKLQKFWGEMSLMRDSDSKYILSWSQIIRFILVAFPRTLFISVIDIKNAATRLSFGYACLRLFKIFRWDEVGRYFTQLDQISRKNSSYSITRLIYVLYCLAMYVHMWACIWLMTGRYDWNTNGDGWYKIDHFDQNPTWYEMYMEGLYYVWQTFASDAMGNITPSTELDTTVNCFINFFGTAFYLMFFVDFVMEFMMRDLKKFENNKKLYELLLFAEQTSLPERLTFKIRYYYKDLSMNFQDFMMKKQIVDDMPPSIKGQVSTMLNREIIESVNFFQQADPDFISQISCFLSPQILMNDDFVVKKDDYADKMFFIHSGYIEVLCSNNLSPLMYLGKGDYFGEVGVLLTGQRSVSVRSKSNSVVYYIEKDNLIKLLDKFPKQLQFLKKIAQQRLDHTPFDLHADDGSSSVPSVQSGTQYKNKKLKQVNTLFSRSTTTVMARKPWLNRKLNALKQYLILPFTPMWWIWNAILTVAIIINFLLIPYGIAFNEYFWHHPLIIFAWIIYMFDIPVRLRTAIKIDNQITIDQQVILKYYIDYWLILDLLTTFPFEYALVAAGQEWIVNYSLLLRLLKIGRLFENIEVLRKNSRFTIQTIVYFLEWFFSFGILIHCFACIFTWLGYIEYERNPLYSGQTFFKDFQQRPWLRFGPFEKLPKFDQYIWILYQTTQFISNCCMGDGIPYTNREQTLAMITFLIANFIRAFTIIHVAQYLVSLQKQQLIKIKQSNEIIKYIENCNFSKDYMKKIQAYSHQIRHQKSVWEGIECIQTLPESLQTEIREFLVKSQLKQNQKDNSVATKMKLFFKKSIQIQPAKEVQQDGESDQLDASLRPDLTKQYIRFLKIKHFKEYVLLLVANWNAIFIPLQFAFRIPFAGVFLAFEIMTILIYLFEVGFYYHSISWIKIFECIDDNQLRRKDKNIKVSLHAQKKEIDNLKYKIIITMISVIPFSLIINNLDKDQNLNMFIKAALSSIRLLKIQPMFKLFRQKQKDALIQWRIISIVYYYYMISHLYACIMVMMAFWDEDWTQNWLVRAPVPQIQFGIRTDPLKRDDLSPVSVYIHALYYICNVFSHVCIGDVSGVKQSEWIANILLTWSSMFIYCFLFADITLLMSNAASQNYKIYLKKRNDVIQQLKNPQIPKKILEQAVFYLDVNYQSFEGVQQEDILTQLPDKLKIDFLFQKYKIVLENFLPFRSLSTTDINFSLAQDLLKQLRTQIFLNETFVVKVGQVMTDTILVLEGQMNLLTIYEGDVLGIFKPGDYFGTALDSEFDENFDRQFFKKSIKNTYPKLKLSPTDNIENRSFIHCIAVKSVTVGYISQNQLEQIYKKHPNAKAAIQKKNRFIFDVGRKAVEENNLKKIDITREKILNIIEAHYENSSSEVYNKIIISQRASVSLIKLKKQDESIDISKLCKMYLLKRIKRENRQKIMEIYYPKQLKTDETNFIVVCEEFIIYEDSFLFKILQYVQFLNRIYISMMTPFLIGFNIQIYQQRTYFYIELASHLISLFIFLLHFRIPVVNGSEMSLKFADVLKNYKKHGFYLDIAALQPINLILPALIDNAAKSSTQMFALWIGLTPLRLIRLIAILALIPLFDKIKMDFKSIKRELNLIGNLFFVLFIMNFAVCAWLFLVKVVEERYDLNWWLYHNLDEKPIYFVYIRVWYFIANIVATVGSPENSGTTDPERIGIIFLMTCGDIIFALGFGMLQDMISVQKKDNPQQNFIARLQQLEYVMKKEQFNDTWQDKVQHFLTYTFEKKNSPQCINADSLNHVLPDCLIKEILYYTNKAFIVKLFKGIDSENLVIDLAFLVKTRIYMPNDEILHRKSPVVEVQYIVEGNASKLDKYKKPCQTFQIGDICGNFLLNQEIFSKFTIIANTFMLVKFLTIANIQSVLSQYPIFLQEISKLKKTNEFRFAKKKSSISNEDRLEALSLGSVKSSSSSHDSFSDNSENSEKAETLFPLPVIKKEIRQRRQTLDSRMLIHTFGRQDQSNFQIEVSRDSTPKSLAQILQKQGFSAAAESQIPLKRVMHSLAPGSQKDSQVSKPILKKRLSQVSLSSKISINQSTGKSLRLNLQYE